LSPNSKPKRTDYIYICRKNWGISTSELKKSGEENDDALVAQIKDESSGDRTLSVEE
jgi:hypothetical protein